MSRSHSGGQPMGYRWNAWVTRAACTRCATVTLLLGLALLPSGCVVIPYEPAAETTRDVAHVPDPERIRLTIGPRTYLADLAGETLKRDPRLSQFDAQTFIDTASPDGELTLARLLNPSTRARIEPLQVDFLVVVREPRSETLEKKGVVLLHMGFFGLEKSESSTTAWAAIVDLRELRLLEQLTSKSTGTSVGAGLFYGLFVVGNTHASARNDVIRNVVQTITKARPSGSLRVVFLAAEPV